MSKTLRVSARRIVQPLHRWGGGWVLLKTSLLSAVAGLLKRTKERGVRTGKGDDWLLFLTLPSSPHHTRWQSRLMCSWVPCLFPCQCLRVQRKMPVLKQLWRIIVYLSCECGLNSQLQMIALCCVLHMYSQWILHLRAREGQLLSCPLWRKCFNEGE